MRFGFGSRPDDYLSIRNVGNSEVSSLTPLVAVTVRTCNFDSEMLKAAPASYSVQLVYMDADNLTNPQGVNHLIVWVETPSEYKAFIDGTSKYVTSPYTQVDGWYFEVQ
jgi:hypothetical protein